MRGLPWDAAYAVPVEVQQQLRDLEAEMPVDCSAVVGCPGTAGSPCIGCRSVGALTRGPRLRGATARPHGGTDPDNPGPGSHFGVSS